MRTDYTSVLLALVLAIRDPLTSRTGNHALLATPPAFGPRPWAQHRITTERSSSLRPVCSVDFSSRCRRESSVNRDGLDAG
jgi:hypothetical protein